MERIVLDMGQAPLLFLVQIALAAFRQQLRKANDRVQRRTQLMTHVRQELALLEKVWQKCLAPQTEIESSTC
jgi:hypothetical protein